MSFLKNPLFKIAGVLLILYFALFANKKNPESLGNRLSSENIKKNFGEMRQRGQYIATNLNKAQEELNKTPEEVKIERLEERKREIVSTKKEVVKGEGDRIKCGDEAIINYEVFRDDHHFIFKRDDVEIFVGSRKEIFLESNIIGMKKGATRAIKIDKYFETKDRRLSSLLKKYKQGLIYKITIVTFDKNLTPQTRCDI